MNNEKKIEESRFANLDNLKFWLILCVVTGHTLQRFTGTSELARVLSLFIYSFHMPVFIFLSGFFSKRAVKEKQYFKIIEYCLVYMLLKVMEYFGDYFEKGTGSFHVFWENGPAWYAFAMAVFFCITMIIQQFHGQGLLIVALLAGLLAGLDNHLGDHFVSMRICTFYPLFLSGFYFSKAAMISYMRIKRKHSIFCKLLGGIALFSLGVICFMKKESFYFYMMILRGKYSYDEMGIDGLHGVLFRLFSYILWVFLIIVLLGIVSEKKSIISFWGQKTMSVYIWHTIILKLLFDIMGGKDIIKIFYPENYVIAAVVLSFIVTILCTHLFCPQKYLLKMKSEFFY